MRISDFLQVPKLALEAIARRVRAPAVAAADPPNQPLATVDVELGEIQPPRPALLLQPEDQEQERQHQHQHQHHHHQRRRHRAAQHAASLAHLRFWCRFWCRSYLEWAGVLFGTAFLVTFFVAIGTRQSHFAGAPSSSRIVLPGSIHPPSETTTLSPRANIDSLDTMGSGVRAAVPKPGPAKLTPGAGLDEWLEEAKQCHYLPESVMKELCEMVKEVLMEESNIQPVVTPVTICGDIHGQFYDLLELFRVSGGMPGQPATEPPATATTIITSDDIEPPTEITNPKLKRKIKKSKSPSEENVSASNDDSVNAEDDEEDNAEPVSTSRPTSTEMSPPVVNADTRFVFLGDFVDRGYFSLETFTLLMCLKAKYPDRIILVRGNHESRQITQVYGFYEECQQKYGNASVWKACCQVFDFLVLAAIVDGEILCVHGGLSPEIRTIDQIRVVARAQEIPHEGAFCDLVWSDPEDVETWAISPRGAGWLFGDKVATEFNHVNGLKLIARAHQLVNEGYKYHFPQNSVVTVWSAPNYCYRCGNVASIMTVDKNLDPKFSIFSAVPDDMRHVPAGRRGPSDYFL